MRRLQEDVGIGKTDSRTQAQALAAPQTWYRRDNAMYARRYVSVFASQPLPATAQGGYGNRSPGSTREVVSQEVVYPHLWSQVSLFSVSPLSLVRFC